MTIAVVGKPKDRHLAAAIDAYETRASRYWTIDVVEVREAGGRNVPPEQVREREGERLSERVPDSADVIVCDETGDRLTSQQFASLMTTARDRARDLAFIVGGAFGVAATLRARAVRRLQLAPFTLPHEMARLVLAEQLYRAGTIARGEPYHK